MDIKVNKLDTFELVLEDIKRIHNLKKADYSDPNNRFSNFEEAAFVANITVEQTFEVMIGIKQARIKQLLQPNRIPQNESLLDSYRDRAVYSILALVYLLEKDNEHQSSEENSKDEQSF